MSVNLKDKEYKDTLIMSFWVNNLKLDLRELVLSPNNFYKKLMAYKLE